MNKKTAYILLAAGMACLPAAHAQTTASQLSTHPQAIGATTVPFGVLQAGTQQSIRWGLDVSWISEENVRRGVSFIGKPQLSLARVSFTPNDTLVNNQLTSAQLDTLNQRLNIIAYIKKGVDVVLNCDQEALSTPNYSPNYRAIPSRWAALINATALKVKALGYPVVGVAPLNEPDYGTGTSWGWKEGNQADFLNIAKLLRNDQAYADNFKDIKIVGGNTLNCDNAQSWYNYLKSYLDVGTTHQLAGSMSHYTSFFSNVVNDGKIAMGDELHNVGDAICAANYGMGWGIWWGFDGVARGEFCKATASNNPGDQLGYAEDADSWTCAAVYRNKVEGGNVQAFVGSSERQATEHSYDFLSTDADVYYDGRGPLRVFQYTIPGGTGYQKGQTNAERLIGIQWGTDVPRREITAGQYIFMNKASHLLMQPTNGSTADGNTLSMAAQKSGSTAVEQQFTVTPVSSRIGGDCTYYTITKGNAKLDDNNWSLNSGTNYILYNGSTGNNEQFYLKYAGNGFYRIVNRHSGLCLQASSSVGSKVFQNSERNSDNQLWRLLPVTATAELRAPDAPATLSCKAQNHSIALEWTASTATDADGYNIYRADTTGNYNTIARRVKGTQFIDNSVLDGMQYSYYVRTIDQSDNVSASASPTVQSSTIGARALTAHYMLEANTADTTANRLDAVTPATPQFTGSRGTSAAISLTDSTYLMLPYGVANTADLSFAAWVKPTSSKSWQRIFDFGNGEQSYVYLTTSNGTAMQLALKCNGTEHALKTSTLLRTNTWSHVAVTLNGSYATIYINGKQVAAGSVGGTLSDVKPLLCYVGRSQFKADPMLQGNMQDVRIYNYALSADDVKALSLGGEPDAIQAVTTTNVAGRMYSIGGMRINQARKGDVVIKGSHKYVQQ